MHALKKTKVIEASLTNLHNSQNAMLWRLGKNIDSSYLQMVVLSHITFFFFPFPFLFNNMIGKVCTKKQNKKEMGKGNTVSANFRCEICIIQIFQ